MKSSNKRKLLTQDQATQTSTETNRVLDIYVTSIEIQTAKWSICLFLIIIQGLLVAGGGERNGMEGIVVGIVGKEGMVRIGGKLKFGIDVGMVGKLGNGGSVGLGSDGWVVGKVGCGKVGIAGKGGSVGLGKVGTTGKVGIEGTVVCKRWRAAKLMFMLEKLKTMKKAKMKHLREGAITERNSRWGRKASREALLSFDGGNEGYHHRVYIGRWMPEGWGVVRHAWLWLGKKQKTGFLSFPVGRSPPHPSFMEKLYEKVDVQVLLWFINSVNLMQVIHVQ